MGRGEVHKCMVAQYEGKRTVGRTRCRWEDNIKMYIHEVGGGGMDWIDLAQVGECGSHNDGPDSK